MDYVDIAERIAHHHAEARAHSEAAPALGAPTSPDHIALALPHMVEAQQHMHAANELLVELQAEDPSLGRMTPQDADDVRQLRDGT